MSGSSHVKITCTGAQPQLLVAMGWLYGQNLNPFCDTVNIHSGHKDPLFKKCADSSDIEARKWLTIGMLYQGPMYNIVEKTT